MTAEPSSQDRRTGFTDRTIWIRGLFMLLFALIYSLTELLLLAVAVFQFGSMLLTRRPNERVLEFGRSLSVFMYKMMLFFTYNTERKPFPFDTWPSVGGTTPTVPPGEQ